MSDFIRDIPSDSTVVKVELKDSSATITFKLDIYEGDKDTRTLRLSNVEASNMLPGWQSESIEGVEIKTESDLLGKTKQLLKEDEEPEESIQLLKSYQVLGSRDGNRNCCERL
jgi:hypothetical protein